MSNRIPVRKRVLCRNLAVSFIFILATTISATQLQGNRVFAAPKVNSIRVAAGLPTFSTVPFVVALREKLFEKEGVKIETLFMRAGVDRRDALVIGTADMASMSTTPLIVAVSKFPDVRAVGLMSWGGEGQKLVVHNSLKGKVKSVRDLAGKKIAIRKGTEIHAKFLGKVLPFYGLTERDVKIIDMNFADMASALDAKQLDAYVVIEPYASAAISRGIGWLLMSLGKPEVFSTNSMWWVTNKKFLKENPETIAKFLRAIIRAQEIINKDFDKAIGLFYDHTYTARGIKGPGKAYVKGEVRLMHYTGAIPNDVLEDFKITPKLLKEVGRLQEIPDTSKTIDLNLWKRAQKM